MSRFAAFGIHLGISFVIFLILAYFVVFEWYPEFFFDTDGGWRGMRIIVFVDMVLGPALTLVVYKAGKPGLKMDLTLIGIFQFVCLFAGTYIVWSERPVAVVYNDGRFTAMTNDDYAALPTQPVLKAFPGDSPKWVAVDVPEDLDAENAFRKKLFQSGRLINSAVEHYIPFDPRDARFVNEARDIALITEKEGGQAALDQFVEEHGGQLSDYRFYTLSTRYTYAWLGFRADTGERMGLLSITAH